MSELGDFVIARLDEDERRLDAGELPQLDEAERRGRLRIMRADGGTGLLLAADPVPAREERIPVPFAEKAAFIRQEVRGDGDHTMLGLVASAYDTHPDWREEWRA